MDFQHKIDRVNTLYDEIDRLESNYETYEEINHEDSVKIIRMHALARTMTIDLIEKGAW